LANSSTLSSGLATIRWQSLIISVFKHLTTGADIITVHIETTQNLSELINTIKKLNCRAGVALNPDRPIKDLKPILELADLVLVMSVYPGFGGQKFIEESIDRVKELVQMGGADRKFWIEIDGGIHAGNVAPLRDA